MQCKGGRAHKCPTPGTLFQRGRSGRSRLSCRLNRIGFVWMRLVTMMRRSIENSPSWCGSFTSGTRTSRSGRIDSTRIHRLEARRELRNTVKAAIFEAPHELSLGSWPTPEPGPKDVVISVNAAGICAGDLYIYSGKNPYAQYPILVIRPLCSRRSIWSQPAAESSSWDWSPKVSMSASLDWNLPARRYRYSAPEPRWVVFLKHWLF